ncbi:MAG: YciI family protein [Blastocatellales bacterium]
MKAILLLILLALFNCATLAQSDGTQQTGQGKPATDESKMPQFDLDKYQLGLLRKGPNSGTGTKEEAEKIQAGHMAHINKMAMDGKLVAAGPMLDDGDLRGIFLFRAASLDEVKALAAEDPAIKSGRLRLELFSWYAPKGIGVKLMEEYKKNPKMPMTMTRHHFVFLKRGPKYTAESTPEIQKLQLEHLWNIRRLMDSGKMPSAGPLENAGDLAGVFVFATESADDAKAWAESDPAVKAGRFVVEIHPWLVAKEVWKQ